MVHSSIGPYKIIREIAEDRLGQVFEAVDSTRKKHVIIKSLRPEAANRPEVISRLYSEAKTLALLNHPHIARIFGFMRVNHNLYLVMEYVKGESLRSILKEKGRLDPNLGLGIFHQILAAVKFAHELSVVHGDLKPSNIMVSSFAQIKVLDFAIAPILGDLDIATPRISSVPYMAPERITRGPVDARSDVYSLGVLLYESIVGRVPFTGNTLEGAQPAACNSTLLPPSLLISNCPKWLDAFLLRALRASPDDRFPSVAAMSQAMMEPSVPIRSRRISSKPVIDSIQRRVQRMSSMPSTLYGAANRMVGSLATNLNGAMRIARQKQASATRSLHSATGSLRRTVIALNPWIWTKRAAFKIQAWTHGIQSPFGSVSSAALKIPGRLKERLTGLTENNWKRYAVLATLLASVLIETFIFGGTNTLLSPDFNSIPALNRNGAAQSILEPLDPRPTPAIEIDSQPEPEPKIVTHMNRGARISQRTGTAEGLRHQEALNSKRTVTYRVEAENHFNRPTVQDVRLSEPSKRNPENNTAKVQLNVRWEN
ncbi:MAG: serine/threonine protein kinase [Candidatus Binatia bacterium]